MAAVDIGVCQNNNFVIAGFFAVELVVADATTNCGDEGLNFGVLQHFVHARALDVENFSADRQDCLSAWVTCIDSGATG